MSKTYICPICGQTTTEVVMKVPDELTPKEKTFDLVRCENCLVQHVRPLLNMQELAPYYISGYWYHNQTDKQHILIKTLKSLEQRFVDAQIQWDTRVIRRSLQPGADILDVGCSTGMVMTVLERAGFTMYGVELSEEAVAQAQLQFRDQVKQGTLESANYDSESFDGITFFHVLEHVQNPKVTLQEVYRIAKPGATILIEVPNIKSYGFKIFGTRWLGLQVPRHLYHFSDQALTKLLEDCGFAIDNVSYFSLRAAPAIYVIGLIPTINPALLREQNKSNILVTFIYLVLYLLAIPFAIISHLLGHGEVLRIIAHKSQLPAQDTF